MSRFARAGLLILPALFAGASSPTLAQEAPPVGEYRAAVMQSIRHHSGALRAILNGDVPFAGHVVAHARALDGLAALAGDMFPEGSGEGTRARPEVWTDADGFREKLAAFQAAASRLADAAEGGDMALATEASTELGRSCRACHTDYRADAN